MTRSLNHWLDSPPDLGGPLALLDPPELTPDGRCSDCWETGARYVILNGHRYLRPCLCPAGARLRLAGEREGWTP